MGHPTPGCGTVGGYAIHLKERTPTCPECRAARASYIRRWKLLRAKRRVVFVEPPVGATRRLQALARDGFTAQAIAAETLLPDRHVTAIWRGEVPKVFLGTHRVIVDVFDRWAGTGGGSVITAKRAERAGFAPWWAWPGGTIDDPVARPNLTGYDEESVRLLMDGEMVAASRRDQVEAVRRLTEEWLLEPDEVARLLHLEPDELPREAA
jgi:hypothetical protein